MVVKKTTKKLTKNAAKAKKTVPKLRKVSVDELASVMAENHAKTEAAIAAMAKSHAETEAAIAAMTKSHAETEAAIAAMTESHAKTEATIDRMSEEIRQMSMQLSTVSQKTSVEVWKLTKNLNESFGGISQRLGKLTELVVVPKIRFDMNAHGHSFDCAEVNKLIRGVVGGRKEDIAEVDMLLCGSAEAMAVEIKTRLKESLVKDHIDRLQDLREHEEDADIKGKKLFGAVVGIVVDDSARELAKKNGLYVVEIREEEDKLKIDKPEQCRIW